MATEHITPPGRNWLLAALAPADFALLGPHLTDILFRQGISLQETGDHLEHVYFPHTGMISLLVVMDDGQAVETATVGQEGALGAMAGLGSQSAVSRAVVQIGGIFSQIRVAPFREVLSNSPRLRDLVVRYNDVQLALISQVAGCNAAIM